jgi:hypothetical protein
LEVTGSLPDVINVRKSLSSLEKQDTFNGYSKVVVVVSDELEYSAGTDSGRTLTLDCPWGTQKMAEDILSRIQGFQYQPYTADGAHIDPAAEIGDGFAAGNLYSGIYSKNVSHGALYTANVSAPGGEKINYKYEYKTPTQRKIERHYSEMKSTFKVQADQISAEVSARIEQGNELTAQLKIQSVQISARVTKTGGDSSSFGWELLDDSWTVKANNTTVFQITKSGAEVRGKITALSGKIGGFDIQSDYLSYNNQVWNGTNSRGIYIGVNGIQCGSEAKGVQITPTGNLYAENGYFRGSVSAGQIQYGYNPDDGKYNGYFNGEGLESRSVSGLEIKESTVTTTNTNGGINTSLGYADYSNEVFSGSKTVSVLKAVGITVTDITIDGHDAFWRPITDGNGITQHVLVYD